MDIPEDAPPASPSPRSSSNGIFLALIPLLFMGGGIFYYLSRQSPPPPTGDKNAFNFDEVPEDGPRKSTQYLSRFEKEAQRRSSDQGPLAGFVPEADKAFARGKAGTASKSAKASKKDERTRLEEEAFIKKHDKHIQRELGRYDRITSRYRKAKPVVKEVDLAFGKLPRYMAVRAQYQKDHNVFAFMRNSIKLPEVRKTIRKYALKPEVWQAAIGMANEALKKKPPQPIYDEAVHFMTHDNTMSKFVTDTTTWLGPKIPMLAVNGIPPGTDMSVLKSVAGDIGVSGAKK